MFPLAQLEEIIVKGDADRAPAEVQSANTSIKSNKNALRPVQPNNFHASRRRPPNPRIIAAQIAHSYSF
jgi:hypothetical protein